MNTLFRTHKVAKVAVRYMSIKPSSTIPSTQSATHPARTTPSSETDRDADTYGEVPHGKDTQQRQDDSTDGFKPKVTEEFADHRDRETGDDHAAKS